MCVRRFTHHVLAVLAALAVVVSSGRAIAVQAIAVQPVVTRQVVSHSDQTTYNWISRSDCLADDVLSFTLTITDPQGSQLEVWVGEGSTDCTVKTNRTGATLSCLRVYSGLATPTPQTVGIRARNIAAVESGIFGEIVPEPPPASYCDKTSGGTAADQVTVYFMLIQSTESVASAPWQTKIDLLGPNPPAKIGLGVGSTLLKASWDLNTDPDVAGYQLFCDPPPGGAPSDAAPVPPATGGSCVDAATAGSADASSSDASDGGASDAGESDAGGSDAVDDAGDGPVTLAAVADEGGACVASDASSAGNCGGFNFVPGVAPSLDVINRYQCGSVSGNTSTSATISGLVNGKSVAVAIAAIDLVKNVGPLSTVACATPDLVNGFDELYHQAGGTAGGGFCSLSRLPAKRGGAGAGLFFVLGWAAAAWRRRASGSVEMAPTFDTKTCD